MRGGISSCSNAWKEAASIPCTRRPPRPCAPPRTSGPPRRAAHRRSLSTWLTPSASRSPRGRSAGRRWKAVARSSWRANASAASASAAPTGRPTSASRARRSSRSARAGASTRNESRGTGLDDGERIEWRLSRCASPASAWAGGRTCSPTRSSAPASSRSSPATRAPTRSGGRSPQNTAAGRRRATNRSWRIPASKPSSIPRRTTRIWRRPASPGKHVFLDKPIANTVSEGRAISEACRKAGVVLALGYQRRRESHFRWIRRQIDEGAFGKLVNAEANISRDRLGKIDHGSWRYTAKGMPGGVMLQIGIHYTDVLEYLLGPIGAVNGRFAQLVLPGDNPDVASLVLEHENGALSTLNASYASASAYYLMNIYGKEASAYYDAHRGLRLLKRGSNGPSPVPCAKNDTFVEELEEFAASVRGKGEPEMGGERATVSLAVVRAGIVSAREGRRVEVAEILAGD